MKYILSVSVYPSLRFKKGSPTNDILLKKSFNSDLGNAEVIKRTVAEYSTRVLCRRHRYKIQLRCRYHIERSVKSVKVESQRDINGDSQ